METIIFFVSFIITYVIGVIFGRKSERKRNASGVIKINTSDPNKDVFRLEVDDLESLMNKKQIVFKIEMEDASQK